MGKGWESWDVDKLEQRDVKAFKKKKTVFGWTMGQFWLWMVQLVQVKQEWTPVERWSWGMDRGVGLQSELGRVLLGKPITTGWASGQMSPLLQKMCTFCRIVPKRTKHDMENYIRFRLFCQGIKIFFRRAGGYVHFESKNLCTGMFRPKRFLEVPLTPQNWSWLYGPAGRYESWGNLSILVAVFSVYVWVLSF